MCIIMWKGACLIGINFKEEEDLTKTLYIKLLIMDKKVDTLFNTCSQANFISYKLVGELGLQTMDPP